MRSPSVAIVVVLLAAVGSCGTRRDPDFCCSNADSCGATGTDVGITPCSDPAAPVCDDSGDQGPPRTCVADIGGTCSSPAECMDPSRPYCIGNRCVECRDMDVANDCDNPTPACNADTHLCGPCLDALDCAGDVGGPQCLNGQCVECDDSSDCTAADRPVCDTAAHTCRACVADSECPSLVCHGDSGTCAAEADVLYVAVGGTGTTCTRAAPCPTLAAALALVGTTPRTIRLGAGAHSGTAAIGGNRSVTLHGEGAGQTTLTYFSTMLNAPFLTVDTGATLTVEGLLLNGAPPTAPGIRCADATVRVFASHLDAIGQGGIEVNRCSFAIVNTAVTRCGSAASNFGGVLLSNLTAAHTTRFEFNTILANSAAGSNVAGVACATLATAVPLRSSIIFANDRGDSVPVGDDSDCVVTHSVIDVTPPAATNTDVAPGLTAPAFHLPDGSSAIDRADPAATVGLDIDGERRPRGAGRDSGADER